MSAGPWALAAVNFGLFANGFDNSLGQSVACLLNGAMLAFMLLGHRPTASFWKAFTTPLTLFALALIWVVVVAAIRALWVPGPDDLPVALDLFLPKFLGTVSGLWALVIGILLGRVSGTPENPGGWLLFLISIHTAFGLYLFFVPDNLWSNWHAIWGTRFSGLIGNSNVTATVCAVGCIIAWGHGLRFWMHGNDKPPEISIYRAILYASIFLLNSVGLMLSASRFVALSTMVILAVLTLPRKGESRVRGGIAIAGLMTLALLAVQSSLAEVLIVRWGNLQTEGLSRWWMWDHFASIVPPALWTGYGPGAFSSVNTYFMTPDGWKFSLWQVNSPHDIFLQLLLVGGVPYLLLMVLGGARVAIDIFWSRRILLTNREHCTLALAAVAVLLSGTIDIALDVPVTTNMGLLLIGICWQRVGTPLLALPNHTTAPVRPIQLGPTSA